MKHVIIILIFIMLTLGITAFILDMTKTKSVNNYLQIKEEKKRLSKEDCKKFADSVGASYADNGIWKNGSSTSRQMANGCLYWTDSGGKTVRYNSVGTGSCDDPHFTYTCKLSYEFYRIYKNLL